MIMILAAFQLNARNVAVLIGVGNYPSTSQWNAIHSRNDVFLLEQNLKEKGFMIKSLVDNQATKKNIINMLKEVIKNSKTGDNVLIHFSCHGQQMVDASKDEKDERDEAIIPYDAQKYYKKNVYTGENHLTDDEFNIYVNKLKTQLGKTGMIFISIDACHSGDVLRAEQNDSIDEELLKFERGTYYVFASETKSCKPNSTGMVKRNKITSKGARIFTVSACSPNERNFEYIERHGAAKTFYGSLSYCLSRLIKESGELSYWADYFKNKKYIGTGIFPLQNPYYEEF